MDPALQHPAPPHESFSKKFQEKLAESRFFALSLMIHVLLVFFAGSIVLYKAYIEPPDFVAEGGDGLIAPTEDLPPPETPQDSVPQEQFTPQQPNINSPNIDVISTTAQTTSFKVAPAQVRVNISTNASDIAKATGAVAKNAVGGLGNLPGTMRGRMGTGRKAAMDQNKMKTATEQAVLKGLMWLQQNQQPDGSWGENYKGAMTGLALLCFLGHGETPDSAQFGLTVNKSVQWFLDNGAKNRGFGNSYEHGIASYAIGEYFTMTKDERVLEYLRQAISRIVEGQNVGGGWDYGYKKVDRNDLSVSGWQIQALKAAHLTELKLPGVDQALDKAMVYVDRVKGPNGGYGYTGPGDKYSLAGIGILSRLFWKGERGELRKGMEWLLDVTENKAPVKYKGEHCDLYAWYYHTQACLMFGGNAWQKWNHWFQDELVGVQNPDGSWPIPGGKTHGPVGEGKTGAVYRTTLCILMLEVFYRYMPTTKG